jgi:hypothetical protein
MKSLCCCLCLFYASFLFSQNQKPLALEDLQGKWYIHFSNFPMWLKGDKTHPTFNYTVSKGGLEDRVDYEKKGQQHSIVGFDKPTDKTNRQFVWRGRGILSLLKSKWQFIYVDAPQNWAVIQFEKTLFTPAGYDVISKNREIDADFIRKIEEKLKELGISETMKSIVQ